MDAPHPTPEPDELPGRTAAEVLRTVSWIYFVASVLGGLAWGVQTVADIQALGGEPNLGIMVLALGIALQGAFVAALAHVLAGIADNVAAMRRGG